jgi:gluconate kinase
MVNTILEKNIFTNKNSIPAIKNLLILAGVSATGKNQFIEKIQTDGHKKLVDDLQLNEYTNAQHIDSGTLNSKNLNICASELILHFDFMHHALVHKSGFKALSIIIQQSQKINLITLCSSAKILSQRHNQRIKDTLQKASPKQKDQLFFNYHMLYFRYKQAIFENPIQLNKYYLKWEQFIASHHLKNHYLLDSGLPELDYLGAYSNEKVKTILGQAEKI